MKKQRFYVRQKGNQWVGEPEEKGGGIVSPQKEEVLEHMRDKARLERPSEVIVHQPNNEVQKEEFEDRPEPNKPSGFISD